MQIVKDLYLVCGFPYERHANIHAVKYSKGIILFDCGTNLDEAQIVEKNLAKWGLGDLPITHVFVTHEHQDHGGNSQYFQDKGAAVYAGPVDADHIANADIETIDFALIEKAVACPGIRTVQDEQIVEVEELKVRCIHIPGHTPGSILYQVDLNGLSVCFGGDSIRVGTNAQSAILGWTGGVDYDRETYIQSLLKVAELVRHGQLMCDVLCGGHFQPMVGDGWKCLNWASRAAFEDLRVCPNII